jgi:hypothetical protein
MSLSDVVLERRLSTAWVKSNASRLANDPSPPRTLMSAIAELTHDLPDRPR